MLKILNKKGYLLFIHPANWRKPYHKTGEEMIKHNVIYELHIFNIKETMKYFKCNVRVDWYLLQKYENNKNIKTKIVDECKNINIINIKTLSFISNFVINIINKMINKYSKNMLVIVRNHKVLSNNKNLMEVKTDEFCYPYLVNLNEKGKRIRYFNKKHSVQDEKKILMSYSLNLHPFYDDGILAPTEHVFYNIVKNKELGKKLVIYLNSKLIKFVLKACKWIGYQTDHKLFEFIPNIIYECEKMIIELWK